MCKFFSFVGDGYGNYLYSDWNTRKENMRENHDSHTAILTRNEVPPHLQDKWSKYEYNPLTKEFTIDEPVEWHDHEAAENWVQHLNFKSIVEPLVIKKIQNPLTGRAKKATEKEIALLDEWTKVRDLVWASVDDSVGSLVRSSIRDSIGDSVGVSVRDSVWYSVSNSVWYSVSDSVSDSIGDSIWDSIWSLTWAYISSFFKMQYEHDFSSAIKLWNAGFVPSFDEKTWRLHSGKDAEIVYEKKV